MGESVKELRKELKQERRELVDDLRELREDIEQGEFRRKFRRRLPMLLASTFALGFVLSGGLAATSLLVKSRRSGGRQIFKAGRYALIER